MISLPRSSRLGLAVLLAGALVSCERLTSPTSRPSYSLSATLPAPAPIPFPWAIFATGNATFTGNAGTDSYNSALGPYNPAMHDSSGSVAAGGSITFTGKALIEGDAASQTTIAGSPEKRSFVTGTITPNLPSFPPMVPLACPAGGYTDASQLSGKGYRYDPNSGALKVDGNGSVTLAAPGTYFFSSITLTGKSTLIVNNPAGTIANVYVSGSVKGTGGGVTNTVGKPSALALWACTPSTSSTDKKSDDGDDAWQFTGDADSYLTAYAPDRNVTITGNGEIFGAVVGANVTETGNAMVHYDEGLGVSAPAAFSLGAISGPTAGGTGQTLSYTVPVNVTSAGFASTVTCSVAVPTGATATVTTPAVSFGKGQTTGGSCAFTVVFTQTGSQTVTVSASASSGTVTPASQSLAVTVSVAQIPPAALSLGAISGANAATSGQTVSYIVPISVASAGLATTVTCSVSVPTGSTATLTTPTVTIPTDQTTGGNCAFTVMFGGSGAQTVTVSATATNGTIAPATQSLVVTVTQTAALAVFEIDHKDPVTGAWNNLNATGSADSAKVGVAGTYQALVGVPASPAWSPGLASVTATCTITVSGGTGTPATQSVPVTITSANIAGNAAAVCPFTFTPTDAGDGVTRTISVTVAPSGSSSSVANLTATLSTLTAAIRGMIRVDFALTALTATVNGVTKPVSSSSVAAGSSAIFSATVANLEPAGGRSNSFICTLNIGAGSIPGTAPYVIQTVNPTAPQTVAAGATGTCTFTVLFNLLSAYPVTVTVAPAPGAVLDGSLANNSQTGTFTVNSGGKFSSIAAGVNSQVVQQLTGTITQSGADALWSSVATVNSQEIYVARLALLVVPQTSDLGSFRLTGTVTSDSIADLATGNILQAPANANCPGGSTFCYNYGTASAGGELLAGAANDAMGRTQDYCINPVVDGSYVYPGVTAPVTSSGAPSSITFTPRICAALGDPIGYPGQQEIYIEFYRMMPKAIANPLNTGAATWGNNALFAGNLRVDVALAYTLTGGVSDNITAHVIFNLAHPLTKFPVTASGLINTSVNGITAATP